MKYDPAIVISYYADHGVNLIAEWPLCEDRNWRHDFVVSPVEKYRIAIEVQGGIHSGGRHSRGSGLIKEYEKMNFAAAVNKMRVLYFVPQDICMDDTVEIVKRAMRNC